MAYDSVLRLYRHIPLDPRYEHTLLWGNRAGQELFFSSSYNAGQYYAYQLTDFSYLRKNAVVRVPYDVETLEEVGINYAAMLNDGKWRYYFVTDKVYKSPGCTELVVELDVMQTYQFDWEIPACFVEREHVTDDTPGAHLVDEALELGEIIEYNGVDLPNLNELMIVVQSAVYLTNQDAENKQQGDQVDGAFVGGVYSGYKLYAFNATDTGVAILEDVIMSLSEIGKSDGIVSMWMYPKTLIDGTAHPLLGDCVIVTSLKYFEWTGVKPSAIGSYTPRNKKLLAYPYSHLYVYNNQGEGAAYHYERFSGSPVFRVGGNLNNDGVVRMYPMNHRGITHDNESGLSLGGYPTCAWSQDMYKIWMAQNANTQALSIEQGGVTMAAGGVQAIAGLINGGASNGVGNMVSGYYQIQGVMAQRQDMKTHPPQSKGTQSSSCNIALGLQTYHIGYKGITSDFARRIDSFFDMYGYKVNAVKAPNLNTRPVWNYVKTIGCIVLGGIDADDRRKIGAIFDKGVTLWHDAARMYRYDLASANT